MGANIDASVPYQNVDTDGNGTGDVQTLFINVFDISANCLYVGIELHDELDLHVIKSPELPSSDLVYQQCEDVDDPATDPFNESLDGIVSFDLTSFELSDLYTVIIDAGGTTLCT